MKKRLAKTIVTMAIAVLAAGTITTTAQAYYSDDTAVVQTWCNPDGSCDVDGVCTIGGYCDGSHGYCANTDSDNGSYHDNGSHHGGRSGHHSGKGHHH